MNFYKGKVGLSIEIFDGAFSSTWSILSKRLFKMMKPIYLSMAKLLIRFIDIYFM